MAERSVVVRIRAEIAEFKSQLDQASKASKRFGDDTQTAGKQAADGAARSSGAMGRLVQDAQKNEEAWNMAGNSLLAFGAIAVAAVGIAVAKYASFDKAMSEVQAATHESAANMSLLRDAAIQAGADTAYSAEEAADAITQLAKAGVSTADILAGGLSGALNLAASDSLAVGDAAEIAATAMTQFGLAGKDIPHIADLLAAGAGKAQGGVMDLANALTYVGPIAAGMGISIDETVGALSAFASQGILSEKAGTGLRGVLGALTSPSKKAATEIDRLGISLYDSNGKFAGLTNMAGQLQKAYAGMTDEQRDFSLGLIFGNEQITAARVLYKQGADGIQEWTRQVNDAGYAAITAAIKQDNLAGDIEKVGGSLDTVFIKTGGSANDALRGLAQTANNLIDTIGQIPGPVLQSGLSIVGIAGGAALLAGSFLKLVPAVIENVFAFKNLGTEGSKIPGIMGSVTKAAGIATAAFAVLATAGAIIDSFAPKAKGIEDVGQAFLKVKNDAQGINDVFNKDFFSNANQFSAGFDQDVNNIGEAIKRVANLGFGDVMNDALSWIPGSNYQVKELRKSFASIDDVFSSLVKGGTPAEAAKQFKLIADSAKEQGVSVENVAKQFPDYIKALQAQANQLGVNLKDEDLYRYALGETIPEIEAAKKSTEGQAIAAQQAAKASEEQAKSLEKVGLSALGTVEDLGKLLDAMYATGLATLSARDAEAKYQENLEGLNQKIAEVVATQSAHNRVLNQTADDFDLTSKAGRSASEIFGSLARDAQNTTQKMAENGATQDQLQAKLGTTYESLVKAAEGFGFSREQADNLARSALGIPKNVDINTAIQNFADTMAKAAGIKDAVENIPNRKDVLVVLSTDSSGFIDPKNMPAKITGPTAYASGGLVAFAAGGRVGGFATGSGLLSGPGTGTSDSILARVSKGEYVVRASSVAKYGPEFFDSLNTGAFSPAQVNTATATTRYLSQVQSAPAPKFGRTEATIVIEDRRFSGYIDFRAAAVADSRINNNNRLNREPV